MIARIPFVVALVCAALLLVAGCEPSLGQPVIMRAMVDVSNQATTPVVIEVLSKRRRAFYWSETVEPGGSFSKSVSFEPNEVPVTVRWVTASGVVCGEVEITKGYRMLEEAGRVPVRLELVDEGGTIINRIGK